MKRIHLPEADTALVTLEGRELVVAPLDECDRADCRLEHFILVPESELVFMRKMAQS